MIAPRWRKVVRDLTARRGRSVLAMVALAAGALEIGAMLYKYALLQPELTTFYGRTHPASATLLTDDPSDSVVAAVRGVAGVGDAEARPVILARARIGDNDWVPAVLNVVRDFDHQRLDTFRPDRGAWPPGPGELLLERTALGVARARIGDSLVIRTPGGGDHTLKLAGTAYAAGLAPAWMEHMAPGFVAWNSVVRGGDESAQVRITVADHPLDEGHIREVADSVKAMLERRGHPVARITVPPPGRHPHADQMAAFLYLLLAFGVLSFALSTVLVAGMIHALMAEQVREIGILQAIGATRAQVARLYLGHVAILAAGGLAIGLPLGIVVGGAYARFAARILNADLTHRPFPVLLTAIEIAVGLAIPMLVALAPIRRAAWISVREALGDAPGAPATAAARPARMPWLSRPLALTLRAAARRRGRLALAVITLAFGGAAFMAALNVADAWTRGVERDFAGRRFDLTASFADPQPIADVTRVLAAVPGVERAEYWPGATPYVLGPTGVPGATAGMLGLEPGSDLMRLPLLAGRWLAPSDSAAAVINRATQRLNPRLAVGGAVEVRLEGRTLAIPIVGIAREMAPMAMIYTTAPMVRRLSARAADLTRSVRIVTRGHDDAAQRAAARDVEAAFAGAGIEVAGMQRTQEAKQGILDHLVIIFSILVMAAVVVVFVGAIALASTLALSVLQRTREIGVLSAIGARPRTISAHVWCEALLIGLLGWVAGLVLSAPLSAVLEAATGNIFFKAPLDFWLSPWAALAWLAVVLVIATAASVVPARRAARLPVREAFAHV